MLHLRKLAICCFLVASVWLVRCEGQKLTGRLTFKEFIKLNEDYALEKNPKFACTVRYRELELLSGVDDEFKELCLDNFEIEWMIRESTETITKYDPSDAYAVLHEVCNYYFKKIMRMTYIHQDKIDWQIELMMKQGIIIRFLVHIKEVNEAIGKMENEIKKLQTKYNGMSDDEARLCVILHEYDWGILGDFYPGKKPSKSPERGAYKPIMKRFDEFYSLVERVADSGNYPPNTNVYYRINRLNEVEHGFKLCCLNEWESENTYRMRSKRFERNTPEGAYEALDRACDSYVVIHFSYLAYHYAYNFSWQFRSMLKRGNIIEFLEFKNNLKIDKTELKNETKKLQMKYQGMQDHIAKFWFILNKYDWGILGDSYPGEKPRNADKEKHLAMPMTTISKDYVPIMVRFNEFNDLVYEAIFGRKAVTSDREKIVKFNFNGQIHILKEVDHDFKLECLKQFEDGWASLQDRKDTPEHAYAAMGKASLFGNPPKPA